MLDEERLVNSLFSAGYQVQDKSVYLARACGAACAIAHALAAQGAKYLRRDSI